MKLLLETFAVPEKKLITLPTTKKRTGDPSSSKSVSCAKHIAGETYRVLCATTEGESEGDDDNEFYVEVHGDEPCTWPSTRIKAISSRSLRYPLGAAVLSEIKKREKSGDVSGRQKWKPCCRADGSGTFLHFQERRKTCRHSCCQQCSSTDCQSRLDEEHGATEASQDFFKTQLLHC